MLNYAIMVVVSQMLERKYKISSYVSNFMIDHISPLIISYFPFYYTVN